MAPMSENRESLDLKSWQAKTLFVCQYAKRRRLTSREPADHRPFWIRDLDFERPSDSRGVHFITNQ